VQRNRKFIFKKPQRSRFHGNELQQCSFRKRVPTISFA
jgi:hypothetical protein